MKRMNFSLLALATALSLFVISGCSEEVTVSAKPDFDLDFDFVDNNDFSAEASFSEEMDGIAVSALNLEGINGTISVVGVPSASTVKISGIRRVKSRSTEDARKHLELLHVEIQIADGEIQVNTVQPQLAHGRQYLVDYTISIPSSMDVIVRTANGSVELDGILSSTSVDLANGKIHSRMSLPLDGMLDLGVGNGDMEIDLPFGTSAQFSATVVNGSIDVFGLDLRNATQSFKSLRGQLGDGRGSILLGVANGNISVRGY